MLVSMEVVPETKMNGPFRTAREYPNLSSYGLEVLCRWVGVVISIDLRVLQVGGDNGLG